MNVAFIPVRGGSKSIPLKNIKPICGKPLVYWTVAAACKCKYIDKVFVASDSEVIRETVEAFIDENPQLFTKLNVIERSDESASDTASTEFAMLEFAEKYDFDNIVLIQATSPLLTFADLNGGFELFAVDDVDSVLSCVRQHRFLWNESETGEAFPSNYDIFHRPRRQEFDGCLLENGAFYITSKKGLITYQNRLSGRIKAYEMQVDTAFEIDEPSDWVIVEHLMKKKRLNNPQLPDIKMFLTDCDGCLTDGGMYYSENGDELKKFNARDGMAFSMLKEKGIITGIITGENVNLNRRRAEKLQLDIIESGCRDKLSVVSALCRKRGIALNNVVYVGDDINDVSVISAVGWGCAPADACKEAKASAKYITKSIGGQGVIREIVENIFGREEKENV